MVFIQFPHGGQLEAESELRGKLCTETGAVSFMAMPKLCPNDPRRPSWDLAEIDLST